jgi:hypothetical protein
MADNKMTERVTVLPGKGRTMTVSIVVTLPEGLHLKPRGDRPELYARIEAVRELWKDMSGWAAEEVRDIVNGSPA